MFDFKTLRNGHWPIFFISLMSAIANLFLPMALVRLLSPEEIGLYKLFFLYAQSIIYISLAGGPLYSVYYWIGKKENADKYLGQAWLLNTLLSLGCAILGLIFITPISHYISIPEKYTLLLIISALTSAPGGFFGEYLTAKGDRVNGSLFNSGFEIIKAFVIIFIVYHYRDIHYAFWGYTILFILKVLLAQFFLGKEHIITFKINPEFMKPVWKYCAPISISGAMSFVVEKIDMIVLSSRLDPIHFAFYSMGSLVIPPLLLLEMSVQKVLIPNLSKAFHDEDFKEMIKSFKKAQSDIAYIMIPAVFGLIIFNRPIIELLFTEAYLESATFLKIYAFTYLTYIIPHDSIPRSTGNTKWIFKLYILLTPLSITTVYFCATYFGAKGALIASIVFMYFPKIPGLLYSAKITKSHIYKLVAFKAFLFYTQINIFLFIGVELLKPLFSTEKNWFFCLAPLYAIIYLGLVNYIKKIKKYDLI
jgi:O-antigen/teichoic acid export membrane protein